MTKMTIDIADSDHRKIKALAAALGLSIKDYILDALQIKEQNLTTKKKKLNSTTTKALKDSRKNKNLKNFKNIEALIKDLNS